MAASEQPVVQKIGLDIQEALQALRTLRAEYAGFKADVSGGLSVGGGGGGVPGGVPGGGAGGGGGGFPGGGGGGGGIPGRPPINPGGAGGGTGMGTGALAGAAALARVAAIGAAGAIAINGGMSVANSQMDIEESGINAQWYDRVRQWAGWIPGLGRATEYLQRERRNARSEPWREALASLGSITGGPLGDLAGSASGLGLGHSQAAASLGSVLAYGQGRNAGGLAISVARDLYNADPTLHKTLSPTETNALAGSLSAEGSASFGRGYNRGVAANLAQKDPLAAAAYIKAMGGGDNAADIARLAGNVETSGFEVQGAMARADIASAGTRGVAARGGNAAAISSAMGGEVSALGNAARELQGLIDAAKRLGDTTAEGRAKLEGYRAQLASVNATMSEIRNQSATVRVGERLDIAATRGAAAASGLSIALTTARSGDAGIFNDAIGAGKASIAAAQSGLNDPDLRPEQKRQLERQISEENVRLFAMRRARYDFGSAFAENRAGFAASYSGVMGAGMLAGASSAGESSDVMFRQGAAAQGGADASWRRLASMRNAPMYYGQDDLDAQKMKAATGDLSAMGLRINAAAPGLAPGQMAALAGLDAASAWALRNGGSGAASGLITQQIGTVQGHLNSLPGALARGLATAKTPAEANAMRYENQSRTASDQMAILALQESRGFYSPSAALGMESDAAGFEIAKAELGPFFARNPLGAYKSKMDVNSRMLGQMRSELAGGGLDDAARRTRTQQIQAMELENMSLEQRMNTGWEGRLLTMSSNMPSFSSQYAGTYRDAILFGNENRVFGAASRAGADRNRGGGARGGSDASLQPGNAFAQGMAASVVSGRVDIVVHMPDGQTYQRQIAVTAGARAAGKSEVMDVMLEQRG